VIVDRSPISPPADGSPPRSASRITIELSLVFVKIVTLAQTGKHPSCNV
jgi:hypothetical protein